ncbi:T9SS type A sorting domain-containing protein [Saprospiraceae bacterium]|nr:T9SS type A sorting domain-containing protein [Saprospiraceae bacterium]
MKKVVIYIALLSVAFIFMSNRSGRTRVSGQGATTSPGESGQFCGSVGCHLGNTFQTDVQLELRDEDGNLVNEYIPGQDYSVNIDIGHTGIPAGYGFQIVSLRDSDDSGISNFFDLPGLTQESSSLQRQYIEQSTIIPVDNIDLNWTAPESGTGNVTFYVAGNAVNGNGNSGGDSADTTQLTITEEIMSSIDGISDHSTIKVYPNPAQNFITIDSDVELLEIDMIDVQGHIVRQIQGHTEEIGDLPTGMYYIKAISKDGQSSVNRLIKI